MLLVVIHTCISWQWYANALLTLNLTVVTDYSSRVVTKKQHKHVNVLLCVRVCVCACTSPFQNLHHDYGMYTWPCASVLAQFVYYHRNWIKGKRVLEVAVPLNYCSNSAKFVLVYESVRCMCARNFSLWYKSRCACSNLVLASLVFCWWGLFVTLCVFSGSFLHCLVFLV